MQVYINYFAEHGSAYLMQLWQHIYISFLAILISAAIGVPLGILCERIPKIKKFINTFFSTLRLIPSLAVLVILIPIMGIGLKPALTALVILAVPPILIQTTLGFSKVPEFMDEVSMAMGMDEKTAFRKVRLPLAMPYIADGIKMATSEIIASTALAAYIGSGGLGVIIYNGISMMKMEYLVIGGGSVAILTLLVTFLMDRLEKRLFRY